MPKYQEVVLLENDFGNDAQAILLEVYNQLGWKITLVANNKILALTDTNGQQIDAGIEKNKLTILSEMVNNELADLMKKNNANVKKFIEKFNTVKQTISKERIEENKAAIDYYIVESKKIIDKHAIETEEINNALNLKGSNLYATYAIIAINVLVFILMILDGAGIMGENGIVHIKWGSNISTLTLSGDWWRLITCTFIHFGIIHVGMNMFSLYNVGVYLEPMLGKVKYITAYLCTGIVASIVSLWWHKDPANSAGASGAVFGMYGLFLALLTSNLIPKAVRDALLKSIGIFVFYNLVYGMKSGVDNAAHAGGLVSGFIIGYLFVLSIKQEKNGNKASWVLPIVIVATLGVSITYLVSKKLPVSEGAELLSEVKSASFKDYADFNKKLDRIIKLQDEAFSIAKDSALDNEKLKNIINNIVIPKWTEAEKIAEGMIKMEVSEDNKNKAKYLQEYSRLKIEEAGYRIKKIDGDSEASSKLNETILKSNEVVEKIK